MDKNEETPKAGKRGLMFSNTPTTHTDGVNVAFRDDGNVYMQLVSEMPDALIENHRTMMTARAAKNLVEIMCAGLNYWPEKPSSCGKNTN